MGFFDYFRDGIPDFAEIAKSITDLTRKHTQTSFTVKNKQSRN